MHLCRIFSVCCLHMTHEHISNAVHGYSSSVTSQMETSSSMTVLFTDEHVYFCQCLLFFFFFYVLRTSILNFFSQRSVLPGSVWAASSFLCVCSPLAHTARNVSVVFADAQHLPSGVYAPLQKWRQNWRSHQVWRLTFLVLQRLLPATPPPTPTSHQCAAK